MNCSKRKRVFTFISLKIISIFLLRTIHKWNIPLKLSWIYIPKKKNLKNKNNENIFSYQYWNVFVKIAFHLCTVLRN
jgi:hypothetical protein